MDSIIGGVKVQNKLFGRVRKRLDKIINDHLNEPKTRYAGTAGVFKTAESGRDANVSVVSAAI